jgi:uroporphyrinogen III methyltransferase/synthase
MERLLHEGLDLRDLKGMNLCAIGSKTATAITRLGLRVDLVPDEFSAEGLTDAFLARFPTRGDLTGLSLLLPRAAGSRDLFPERVRQLGGRIDTPTIYRAVRPDKHGKRLQRFMSEGRISLATFTSGGAFNNFFDMLGEERSIFLKDVTIAVIGPVTKNAVEKKGLTAAIMPSKATIPAMVEEIIKWASQRQ